MVDANIEDIWIQETLDFDVSFRVERCVVK